MASPVIPSPFAAHGLCYIGSGFVADNHRPTFVLRPGASGNLVPDGDYTNRETFAWYQQRTSSYNPSQIVYGKYLYTLHDQGFLTCHDALTGEEIYGTQRLRPSGYFTASPFAFNGRLFALSEDGLAYVIQPGPEFEITATNALDERCLSSPAIVEDKLLIRTASKLYCLQNKGPLGTN
jgi:outer membrane protein assembly factor BamB